MKLNFVFDSAKVSRELKKVQKSMAGQIDRALLQTAQFGTQLILDRTAKGQSYTGGGFEAYNPKYALFRQSKGRQVSPVNLNFSGKMLGSMASAKVKSGVAKIYFTRATEAKKAAMNDSRRPFFGFGRLEQERLRKFFIGRIKL